MLVLLFAALCASDPAYVLADVRLFDGRGGAVVPAHIVIRGALIEKILAAADKLPEGVEVRREFAGMTVIPGLIDAHVHHFSDEFDALFLASGVTTVRDLGGDEASTLERRRASFLATDRPRVYVCGPISDGSPPVWPFSVTPSTPGEARSEVERLVKAGVSPKDALLAAGAQATEAIGAEAEIGTLEAGKIADLVVLERDPLADIANTRTIAAVIHRGVLRTMAQLASQGRTAEQR
jgi:imidazolonepropionase-like amidohydrolase